MKYKVLLFCIILFQSTGYSQIIGNPVGTKGTKKWSVSVNGTYMVQDYLHNTRTSSRRLLIKSEWGITPWLDFYALGGGYDLKLDFEKQGFTDFKSKMKFCYGAGLDAALQPKSDLPLRIWTGAQIFLGPAEGDYFEHISFAGTSIIKKYRLEYNWMESKGFLGLIYYGKLFKLYIAVAGWLLQNTSTIDEYSQSGTSWNLEASREGEDSSGIWTGGIIGLEFDLPSNYALTFECLAFNEQDFQLMVGFSQTGTPGW
ncbi:MAG: hypothetical protein R6V04_12600 [bacterium]